VRIGDPRARDRERPSAVRRGAGAVHRRPDQLARGPHLWRWQCKSL